MDEHHDHSSSNINELPDEILRMLFSYFSPQQLCSTFAPVCAKWHQFTRSAQLWRNLTLEDGNSRTAVELFSSAPLHQLKTLTVKTWDGSIARLLTLVSKHCTALEHLTLGGYLSVSVKSLVNLAAKCPDIRALTLSSSTHYSTFPCFPKLTRLQICFVALKTAKDAEIFDKCEQLQSLDVKLLPRRSMASDGEHVKSFLEKHKLRLTGFDVLDDEIPESCYMKLGSCTNLVTLTLNGGENLTGAALVTILSGMKRLRTLYLEALQVTSAQLISALCKSNLNRLVDLTLRNIDALTDDVLIAIADRFSTQLKVLNLEQCWELSDNGVIGVVTKCTNLESLTLIDIPYLTEASLRPMPAYLTKLTSLEIGLGRHIKQGAINELKNAMPNLTVE